MACIINASTSNGLVNSADGSGIVKLQSNGVATNALAWVNFNGTGTVAIRSSYNVSSITDNGTGDYTVNFATALSDANYAVIGASMMNTGGALSSIGVAQSSYTADPTLQSTTQVRMQVRNDSSTIIDNSLCYVAVFGN